MDTNPPTASGLEPLLTIEELGKNLDVPVATIRDVNTWLARQREPSSGHSGRTCGASASHGGRGAARRSREATWLSG